MQRTPPFRIEPRSEAAREVAADVFISRAATGGTDTRNMDPRALRAHRFPLHCNAYDLELIQRTADLGYESKQQLVRRIVREYCERKLKAAGVPHP